MGAMKTCVCGRPAPNGKGCTGNRAGDKRIMRITEKELALGA